MPELPPFAADPADHRSPPADGEPADPGRCACTPNSWGDNACFRAERRVIAAAVLQQATAEAERALLAALDDAATELVGHPVRGPETVAALLDHARGRVAAIPASPDPAEILGDPRCAGCTSPACSSSNGLAASSLARAARLAAVRSCAVEAAGTLLAQAQVFMAEGTEFHSVSGASHRLLEVFRTAAAALGRTCEEQNGRRSHRPWRRGPYRVNFYKGARQWHVRGRRAWW